MLRAEWKPMIHISLQAAEQVETVVRSIKGVSAFTIDDRFGDCWMKWIFDSCWFLLTNVTETHDCWSLCCEYYAPRFVVEAFREVFAAAFELK
jgi:hypothetical protein